MWNPLYQSPMKYKLQNVSSESFRCPCCSGTHDVLDVELAIDYDWYGDFSPIIYGWYIPCDKLYKFVNPPKLDDLIKDGVNGDIVLRNSLCNLSTNRTLYEDFILYNHIPVTVVYKDTKEVENIMMDRKDVIKLALDNHADLDGDVVQTTYNDRPVKMCFNVLQWDNIHHDEWVLEHDDIY